MSRQGRRRPQVGRLLSVYASNGASFLRFVKRHLCIAFQTWTGRVLIIDQRKAAAARRLHRCQRRVLRHFYSVAVWMALQSWKQLCYQMRAQDGRTASGLGIMERCVRRWLLHKVGRYLATWASSTIWLRNLEKVVARLRRRREAIGFATWSGERFRMERRDVLRRGLKAQRRWLRRLRHFSAQKAWRSWTASSPMEEKWTGRAASSAASSTNQ